MRCILASCCPPLPSRSCRTPARENTHAQLLRGILKVAYICPRGAWPANRPSAPFEQQSNLEHALSEAVHYSQGQLRRKNTRPRKFSWHGKAWNDVHATGMPSALNFYFPRPGTRCYGLMMACPILLRILATTSADQWYITVNFSVFFLYALDVLLKSTTNSTGAASGSV